MQKDRQINLLILNRENIIHEIKFLTYIHEIPSVAYAVLETQFAKASSLEIFSHENIFSWCIINLTNGKGSCAQNYGKRHLMFAFSAGNFSTKRFNNASG